MGVPGTTWLPVLAQGGGAAGEGGAPVEPMAGFGMLPLLIGLAVLFYFMIIRPQRKQQLTHEQMLRNLRKNDEVRTTGGIFGRIVGFEEDADQVVLRIDENQNVRIRVLRSSIAAVLGANEKNTAPAVAAGKSR